MFFRDLGPRSSSAVVLLHGCPTPADHFTGLAETLAPSHRVILPDLPGYGGSPQRANPDGAVRDAIVELVHRLELDSVAFVGISWSGHRALQLAASHALRVAGIVSLGGFAWREPEDAPRYAGYAAAIRAGQDMSDVAIDLFYSPRFQKSHPEVVARSRGWGAALDREWYALEVETIPRVVDLRPILHTLAMPILAIAGEADKAVPASNSCEIARRVQHGHAEILPGAGHLVLDEEPDEVNALIASFLGALPSPNEP